jgi:hypothetical protein
MGDQFMTFDDWNTPSPQLKCAIQNLVCGLDCINNNITLKKTDNNYLVFSGPEGTLAFLQGGISEDNGQLLTLGTDNLPYISAEDLNLSLPDWIGTSIDQTLVITENPDNSFNPDFKVNIPALVSASGSNLLYVDSTGKLKVNCPSPKIYTSPDNSILIEEKNNVIEFSQIP